MPAIKKLIEVSLPLDAINAEAAREKSIRHGHPSTLHLWWARRPLAAARAVLWASLVDDPSSHPELFPTEVDQDKERQRLHNMLAELVKWENSDNEKLLEDARAEIRKYMGGEKLVFLDPFAGGGSIPLEAQRLGLEAHAHDLNPVAVMINKAMIEIPPKFANLAPVNPEARNSLRGDNWPGASGLAEDVRYYGQWMREEAFKKIGHLYPKVELPDGGEATVIACIWARTVQCPNPACGCEMPLASSFVLSRKKGKEAWIEPVIDGKNISYIVHSGKCPEGKETNKLGKGGVFKCPACGAATEKKYVYGEFLANRNSTALMAIVAEGIGGRIYSPPDIEHEKISQIPKPEYYPQGEMPKNPRWFSPPMYGLNDFSDIFTPRQLTALTTFSDLVIEAQAKAEADAIAAGMADDGIGLANGGCGAKAYGQAVGVYLAFVVNKLVLYHSSISTWHITGEKIRDLFGRQAVPMSWDFAEANPFCSSTGSYDNMFKLVVKCIYHLSTANIGAVKQQEARNPINLQNLIISSDPPYYDNIGYADLSDYFYIWMRRSLKNTYPDIFKTMLVPKTEELVATPYRFGGDRRKAKEFFESGMKEAFVQMQKSAKEDAPVTIYYAFKQSETDNNTDSQTASTGWETMLSAIIEAGFSITGTWPLQTELGRRMVGMNTNALASSIVLVCRKRPADAPATTRRAFMAELKKALPPALRQLQAVNIAPVDMAQAAIGPGMAVYSRYGQVLDADGRAMGVRQALQAINAELDSYLADQDGAMDGYSRFCLDLYSQYAFNEMKFGEADVLARAKNTSVDKLADLGLVFAQRGIVRLLSRAEMPAEPPKNSLLAGCLWLLAQYLAKYLEKDGVAKCAELAASFEAEAGRARDLAYRLYAIAERKKWAEEAFAYNSLVTAWPEIMAQAGRLKIRKKEQGNLDFGG